MDIWQIVRLAVYIVVPFLTITLLNGIFRKIAIKKNSLALNFIKNIIEVIVIIFCVVAIVDLFDQDKVISQRILMSSSVIAVVLSIIFQTGFTNLVHGIIIVLFKPFDVGDRVQMDTGAGISGYVKQITLRHVVITNIVDNADLIIPNSVVETCVIKNLSNGKESNNKYPLVVGLTYKQAMDKEKRDLAKHIVSDCILNNPRTIDIRTNKDEDLFVKVDYSDSSVDLTCFVVTGSAEDNIIACSEIKEAILDSFGKNNIEIAYNHLEISGSIASLTVGE